ncbi:MAG: nucleotidyltransferase domain-containing protein [Candidatus Omnitrophica bacterium]|nr:nucleotidyltransferase domain-containing protein [Candidatus Omnitrophota bacterium]MBI5024823.1 nucleotidyltransferase domain-containing protein [Candidatus Omnitrophota bacterium]
MSQKRQKIKKIIDRYRQELKNLGIKVEKVILYGSYAKGNPREDSDIDLIVVSGDFIKLNLRERLEVLGLAAGKVFEPIEARGYTPGEIKSEKRSSFLGAILRSASMVYEI